MASGRPMRLAVGVGLMALAMAGCQAIGGATPLPVYMALPSVTLTDQDGHAYSLAQTRGKITLLAPIYTSCADVCPLTTARMQAIQGRVKDARLGDRVMFVSASIDPARDSPDVLKQYAKDHGVDTSNWVFLTGSTDATRQLVDALKIYVERVYTVDGTPVPESTLAAPPAGAGYEIDHSDLIFLADREGNVRVLLPGSQTDVDEAMQDIRQLAR